MKRTKIDVGICTLAVICLLGTTVFAVSEQFSTGNAGIRMFGKTELEAGETIAAPNGQEIPGVITYTDEAGGMTITFLSGKLQSYLMLQYLGTVATIALLLEVRTKAHL